MAEAFQRPSSFTMVMVPDTCAAAVLSVAVSRAAENRSSFLPRRAFSG